MNIGRNQAFGCAADANASTAQVPNIEIPLFRSLPVQATFSNRRWDLRWQTRLDKGSEGDGQPSPRKPKFDQIT